MKLSNRKPLFLALALTFAAPLAFAQSTTPTQEYPQSTTQPTTQEATDAAKDAAKDAAQDATTQTQNEASTTNEATANTSGEPQKKNWSDLDTNKNGTLSASEAASVQSLASAFSTADSNADGELTQDEYKAYLETSEKGGAAKSDSGG